MMQLYLDTFYSYIGFIAYKIDFLIILHTPNDN